MEKRRIDSKYIEEGIDLCAKKKKTYFVLLIIISILLKFQSANFYTISFILASPNINCSYPPNDDSAGNVACNVGDVCQWNKNNPNRAIGYTYDPATSGDYSIVTTYNLECENSTVGLIGSAFSLGNAIFTFLYPILQLGIGDALTVKLAVVLGIIFYSLLFIFPYLWMQALTGLVTFGLSPLFTNNFQIYFNDFVDKEKRGFYTMALNSLFPLSGIIYTFIFYFIATWESIRLATLILLVPTFILMVFVMVDSPIFKFNKHKIDQAINCLHSIAKINNSEAEFIKWKSRIRKEKIGDETFYFVYPVDKQEEKVELDESINYSTYKEDETLIKEEIKEEEIVYEAPKSIQKGFFDTFSTIFKHSEERTLFLVMCFMFLTAGFARCYVSVQLTMVKRINLISIIFFFIEGIIFIVQGFFSDSKKGGRTLSMKVLFGVGAISLTITLVMTFIHDKFYRGLVTLLIVRLSQETASRMSMAIGAEIYSRDVNSWAYGINLFISRLIGVVATYVILTFTQLGMFILIILNILAFVLVFFIKETAQVKIFNTIEEKYNEINKQPGLKTD